MSIVIRDLLALRSKPTIQVGLGAAIALAVRLMLLPSRHGVDWDGFFYLWYSHNILMGDLLHPSIEWAPYPLGYPLAIAAVSKITKSLEGAGLLVSLLAGVLLILPLFILGRRLGGRGPACLAILLVALNSWLVRYSLSVLTESLFIFLLVSWAWLLVMDFQDQRFKGHALLMSAVSAGLVFVRPVGLAVLAGGILIQVFRPTRRLATAFRFALVGSVIAVAYTVYAQAVASHLEKRTGQPQPSYALQEMAHGLGQYYGDSGHVALYQPSMSAGTFLRANGFLVVQRYISTILAQLSSGILWDAYNKSRGVFPFYLWPFAASGVWRCASERWRLALFIALLPYVLAVPLFAADPRYYVPLVPFFLLYSAVGLGAFVEQLGKRAVAVTTVSVILIVSALHVYEFNPHKSEGMGAYEEIGCWLREHERPDVVFAHHPAPAYYAGALLSWLQSVPVGEQLSPKVNQRGQRIYVVAAENEVQPESPSAILTPVYTSRSAVPARMVAYRVGFW